MSETLAIEDDVFPSAGGELPWALYKIDHLRSIDRYIDYFGATADQRERCPIPGNGL